MKHGWLRRPYKKRHPLADLPTLLAAELVQDLHMDEWSDDLSKLAETARLPPGKRNHVQGVAAAHYDFIFHSGDSTDDVDPLNTQPVWELALQIPTHTLLTGGISRGLARIAFADLLPEQIRKRQGKGTGHFFYQHVVRRNRDYLRERLADGLLVRHNYLDRDRLLACLAVEDPSMTIAPANLLTYLSAEIWMQQWSTVKQRVTSGQPLQSAAM
jgi:asparagine synthase (glutamine-hydrolysing)